ncbi:MAG: hypothetical protein CMP76_09265 [Flavobacterium sp.]|uniref:hypothetical protein n=1 Tax=Flavobacterium sp. TaxID=239 RepID=UPI000C43FE2A|nr:hypothetical protein [Flavobacterium sp.]MBF03471.1 hypothetical protein [Flavobacterium sp.]
MKKLFLSVLAISGLMFTGCSSDDSDTPVGPTTSNLSGNLFTNLTLENNGNEYILNGALFVKDGATLTIEPGVTVKALAGGTDVYILVEKGGKIVANGTAASPIKFTSNATSPSAGDWGGIILNGKAPLSRQSGSASDAATEVNTGIFFGGDVPADNSGIMNYVILEYTGARIDDESEHNGLTLNGVGSGTTISNIFIKNGDDDGIEFFGGTVNASNILVVNAKDDMFDYTQGYTGTCTNLYGVREAGYTAVTSDPRGIEADGNLDGNTPTDINQSVFTINGVTIINNGGVDMTDAIKIRRGATATITGAYVMSGSATSTYGDFVDLEDSRGNSTSATTITVVGNSANGLDITDNKNAPGATINATNGTSGSVATSLFSWTGYSF